MQDTTFLSLYFEPLNTWLINGLIKDSVRWEDSIKRKNGNFSNPEKFPSKTNRTSYKGFL